MADCQVRSGDHRGHVGQNAAEIVAIALRPAGHGRYLHESSALVISTSPVATTLNDADRVGVVVAVAAPPSAGSAGLHPVSTARHSATTARTCRRPRLMPTAWIVGGPNRADHDRTPPGLSAGETPGWALDEAFSAWTSRTDRRHYVPISGSPLRPGSGWSEKICRRFNRPPTLGLRESHRGSRVA
jgi:hypothetical protein